MAAVFGVVVVTTSYLTGNAACSDVFNSIDHKDLVIYCPL